MRHLIYIFLLLFSLPALSQIRPDQFPEKETATGTDEIYTQSGGVAYRIVFDTAKTFFAPDIDQVALAYSIDSSGANVVDSLRGRFVLDAGGNWWYVDYDKTAVSIGTAGGGGGSGETNTMANVGDGTGIYYQKDGVQFQLKSLKAGGIASLSNTDTTITITATEVDGSIANELDTITIAGDSGSVDISDAETLTIAGAGIATTAVSGNTLTVTATEVDGSTTNELGTVSSITAVPDTSGLSPVRGDAFINAAADTLGLYSGAGWVLFYGGGGVTDGDKGDITVSGSGETWTIDANGGSISADGTDTINLNKASYTWILDVNAVSSTQLTLSNPIQWGVYLLHIKNTSATDTITFPDNLISAYGDTLGRRCFDSDALFSFYYDGTNYFASDTVGVGCPVVNNPVGGVDTIGMTDEYKNILAYGDVQGYSLPSQAVAYEQDTIIQQLKSSGAWAGMDVFYVFASDADSLFALINWIDPGTNNASLVPAGGLIDWTANEGYFTDGANSYINTNYNPSTDAINFSLNSAGIGVYHFASDSTISAGVYDATGFSSFVSFSSGTLLARMNNASASGTYSQSVSASNSYQLYRTSSSNITGYAAGVSAGVQTVNSGSIPNGNMYIGARNRVDLVGADLHAAATYSVFFISNDQSGSASSIYNTIQSYISGL